MQLISARLRDYRLHRELDLRFDRRLTLITGPNQSGKSTLAEALHRVLFLPARSGGALLEAMRTDPFVADPRVELVLRSGGGDWTLRKRFAGSRGSVTLQDPSGRSFKGDEAEEALARLVGTAAVARNRSAAEQLRERWGHLWVWQGSSSANPLERSAAAYDHDRLVERLQAGTGPTVQSALDLSVSESIEARWSAIHTPGSASRAPQVRKGSPLAAARQAARDASDELAAIEGLIREQQQEQETCERAGAALARLAAAWPQRQQEQRDLQQRQETCRSLQQAIGLEEAALKALGQQLQQPLADREQLRSQLRRREALEAELAPQARALETLRGEQAQRQQALDRARTELETLRRRAAELRGDALRLEQRHRHATALRQQRGLAERLSAIGRLQGELEQLEKDLARLPAIDAGAVERLRTLQQQHDTARARAEAMAAGLEVLQAGLSVRLDGRPLEAGSRCTLSQAGLLEVGDAVAIRLLPGGGGSIEAAKKELEAAAAALARGLDAGGVASVEAAATTERRRSDLLAQRERLLEQRGSDDAAALKHRQERVQEQIEALPEHPEDEAAMDRDPEARLIQLEQELQQARSERDQAQAAAERQAGLASQAERALEEGRRAIEAADAGLAQARDQLLQTRTRIDEVLTRAGSLQELEAAVQQLETQRTAAEGRLAGHRRELAALDPEDLARRAQELTREIGAMQEQQRQAEAARIRAESRLQGNGSRDLQAEREQKQAQLEACGQEQQRLETEANVLSLLRRLLEEERNAMASRYTAPISERISAYLAPVFAEVPRADLSYDARNGFGDLGWRRGGEAAFPFAVLSTGAREQFAAALRLAMAEVLAEAYEGCLPLVFDDAFAACDPERQQGVHRMLRQAADRGLQVIVLSCDPERSALLEAATRIELGS
ncbi:AAA family ATPase [Synechococcus sp. RSCCF101]|uniref:AAA family ATPase n=1 Tax=Synechococcus sp. RSCCF101 TaxID=2511069 RepID=UPI001785328A|nr:AAA family ATPase [Synechococcus sp. RSCCF101]